MGVLGLSLASGTGAWIELTRLRQALRRLLPTFDLPWADNFRLILLALAAAAPAACLWRWFARRPGHLTLPQAAAVLLTYGLCYLLAARLAHRPELAAATARLSNRFRRPPRGPAASP
jgi:hypothetical protein